MERYYPKESSTAEKMVTEVSKATETTKSLDFREEALRYKLIQADEKLFPDWSLLDLQECHGRVNATFKC